MERKSTFFLYIKHFFQREKDFSLEESTLYTGLLTLLILGVVLDTSAFIFLSDIMVPIKLVLIHFVFLVLFIGVKRKTFMGFAGSQRIILLQLMSVMTVVLGLASFWFETKGILGAVCFSFLLVIVLSNTLLPTHYHSLALLFTLFIILLLGIFEYFYPQWLKNPYPNEQQEKVFAFILLIMGVILCGLILSYFKKSYEKSHAELVKKNEELQKTNQELDNLIYSISHDLRAPIVSIQGLVSLRKGIAQDPESQQYIELEERSLDKLDKFIQDLLAYSRINRMEVVKEVVDLQTLTQEILQQVSFYHQAQQKTKQKAVDLSLSCHLTRTFYSDKVKLQIILQNLVSNAVNYADFTKENPFCKIEITQDEQHTIIKIQDNGLGIDSKHGNRIFDMFYRANTNSKGSGLGLYIVKEAVEKMKGTISFESKQKEGTTFYLVLT